MIKLFKRIGMKKLFYYFILLNGTMLFLGFLSFLHPVFDALTHFRVYLLGTFLFLLCILLIIHTHYRRSLLFLLLLVLSYMIMITLPFNPSEKYSVLQNKKSLTLMQFNLNFRNEEMQKFADFIHHEKIELITLQEVTTKHKIFLKSLKKTYPYQAHCKFTGVGDVAILSVYPFVKDKGKCIKTQGFVWKQIRIQDKNINIASLHLHWPFPYHQEAQVQKITKVLEQLNTMTIIAGDFNAVSWSHSTHQISQASHTQCISGLRWTLNLRKFPFFPQLKLPIDHILISPEIEVESIEVSKSLGSDHLPLLIKLRI